MIKTKTREIEYKDGTKEKVQVVEVGFRTFLNCMGVTSYDTDLAEAAVRRSGSAGVYDIPVTTGWLDTLSDDSAEAVIQASNELNLTPARAKKAAGLLNDRFARIAEQPIGSAPSGE